MAASGKDEDETGVQTGNCSQIRELHAKDFRRSLGTAVGED